MDIEFNTIPHNSSQLFTPISFFPATLLYQQQITLENVFASTLNNNQNDILLTLIDRTLLISNALDCQIQPYAAVELSFDVKF